MKSMKTNLNIFLILIPNLLVGCQGINKNFQPKKDLTQNEVKEASKSFCPNDQTLVEVPESDENGSLIEFREVTYGMADSILFYFNKGSFRCALESNYEDRPFMPMPPFFDFHTITEVSFNSGCLPNNVLLKVTSRDHFDSVINTLTLEPLAREEEHKNLKVKFRTHDNKTLLSLNKATGLKILNCQEAKK